MSASSSTTSKRSSSVFSSIITPMESIKNVVGSMTDCYEEDKGLQLDIEKARVIDILNEFEHDLCVVLSIDNLIEDSGDIIKQHVTESEMDIIREGFFEKSVKTITFSEANLDKAIDSTLNCTAIQVLCKNFYIPTLAECIIKSDKYSKQYQIYSSLKKLKNFFVQRLVVNVEEERRKDEYLVTVWDKNEAAKKKIAELTEKLDSQRKNFSTLIHQKEQSIRQQQLKIEKMNWVCKEEITANTKIAERRMANDWHELTTKQSNLKELSKQINNELEALLAKNLQIEKTSRQKRLKLETQLLQWIEKYDVEMGNRQDRFDLLLEKYEDENHLLEEMRARFDEQEQIYTELMKEKQDYMHNIWLEKVHQFVLNIAARHIQRWFRKITKTIAAKKRAAAKGMKARGKL